MATQIAPMLRGKDMPAFAPNVNPKAKVLGTNIDKAKFTGTKLDSKVYYHYSGYPGGLREVSLQQLVARKGYGEALRHAIKGMLPRNTMLTGRLKRLKITE